MNSKSSSKRIRRRVGDVAIIPLGEGNLIAYAVVLDDASFAIFDARGDLSVERALQRTPMFYVAVMDSAIKSGRWPVITVPKDFVPQLSAPATFMQDPLNPEKIHIYHLGRMTPATREDIAGLECTAVWSPEHVEDRVRDEYFGRRNKWLESLMPQGSR